ncbi:MAG: hypothetical protein ALAOOOJD_01414 [bacterium]|nr:hypothetical protein [bacterium]
MKANTKWTSSLIAAVFLAMVNTGVAQVGMQKSAADLFKTIKVGQWVELEGTLQSDFSLSTKKVKFLTGDFQDDDWELKGVVKTISPTKKQFTIGRISVLATAESEYESPEGTFKGFADLKTGMLVECEGTFLKDGTFSAEEIQQETDFKPNELNEIRAVGKVEKIDPIKRTVTMMGTTFKIVEATKVQSVVK